MNLGILILKLKLSDFYYFAKLKNSFIMFLNGENKIFIMFFKSKEEKKNKEQLKEQENNRIKLLDEIAKEIYIFPGNKKEYEEFKGYKVEVIDTKRSGLGITYFELIQNPDFGEYLVKEGIEAIINARVQFSAAYNYYGLPVRKSRS